MGFEVKGVDELVAGFTSAFKINERAKFHLVKWGGALKSEIASRAPGTNYPGSIKLGSPRSTAGGVQIEVSSDRPDAFRKERGFHSKDSRGRTYQAPGLQRDGKKHFEPGLDAIAEAFAASLAELAANPE